MRKLQYSNKVFALVSVLLLTSCSSSNVNSEWDCPRQKGYGCLTIEQADAIALQRLTERSQTDQSKKLDEEAEIPLNMALSDYYLGRYKEVWFAPFVDSSGHLHEASIVKYKLEEGS